MENITKLKQGVIYYRVSTEDQANFGVSLEQQRKACLDYAERNNIEILKKFHDDGLSAKTTDRQGLQDLIKFCINKSKAVDCVVIYKIDRLSRNLNDYTNIKVLLTKLKIKLISTTEAIDDTPTGKFIGNVMAANAQLDNDIKSQRVSACMIEKLKQGIWCWKAPLGYLNSRDELNRKIITADKKRADIIKIILEKFSTGFYTQKEIKKFANEKGLKTWKGKEISAQLIYKILTNKFYVGIMTASGQEYKGTHETLIDEKTFYKCQEFIKGSRSNISHKRIDENFPLRGFVICSCCGRPLTAAFSRNRWGKRYPYYRCYNSKCISIKSITKKKIEDEFFDYLKNITPKKEYLNAFKAVITDVWQTRSKETNSERENMIKKLDSLKQEKEKLIEMKKKELFSDEDFKESFAKVKQEIISQEIIFDEIKIENFDIEKTINYVFNFIVNVPEFWQRANFSQKQKIQGLIFPEKPIYNYSTFETPKISLFFQQKKELAYTNSGVVALRGIEPLLPG